MKALIVVAAAALAFPVYAQQKNDTTLPNAQERQHNRDKVANEADKAKEALPDANERAKNRETVSSSTAGAALTTKVKTALMAEPGLRSLEINVDTRDNIVTLNGTVDSQEKKQRAMQIAQKVEGVKSVSDNLVVKSS